MMGKTKRWIFSHEKLYAALIGVLNLFGGNPARIIKENIDWSMRRL